MTLADIFLNFKCENCVHSCKNASGFYCTRLAFDYSVKPDDFCSRFEREEEENC